MTGRSALAAALLVLAALAIASTATPTPHASAATCSPARPHESGTSNETITWGGLERDYVLHVPPSYDGVSAMALVLNLHGYAEPAQTQSLYSGLTATADAEGFVTVAPEGTGLAPHWNFTTVEPGAPDDIAFLSELIDALAAQLCVDSARVFVAGISNGAAMTARLACNLSDKVAAVAPVAGLYYPLSCPATRAVPVLAFHGTEDPLVPYEGGALTPQGYPTGPVEESLARWAEHDGCTTGPLESDVTEHVTRIEYGACTDGASVQLYRIFGGGHTWPGAAIDAPQDELGATTHEISANDLMWAFFSAHPLPDAAAGGTPVPGSTDDEGAAQPEGSDSNRRAAAVIAGAAAVAAVALLGAGFWVVRRRRAEG